MHENVWTVLSDVIVKLLTKFALSYVSSWPESECVLLNPCIGHTRRLLRLDQQIYMATLLSAVTTPVNTMKIFVTPLLCCTTATLVHTKVLTYQAAYHRDALAVYIDAISSFTKNMCSMLLRSPRRYIIPPLCPSVQFYMCVNQIC